MIASSRGQSLFVSMCGFCRTWEDSCVARCAPRFWEEPFFSWVRSVRRQGRYGEVEDNERGRENHEEDKEDGKAEEDEDERMMRMTTTVTMTTSTTMTMTVTMTMNCTQTGKHI